MHSSTSAAAIRQLYYSHHQQQATGWLYGATNRSIADAEDAAVTHKEPLAPLADSGANWANWAHTRHDAPLVRFLNEKSAGSTAPTVPKDRSVADWLVLAHLTTQGEKHLKKEKYRFDAAAATTSYLLSNFQGNLAYHARRRRVKQALVALRRRLGHHCHSVAARTAHVARIPLAVYRADLCEYERLAAEWRVVLRQDPGVMLTEQLFTHVAELVQATYARDVGRAMSAWEIQTGLTKALHRHGVAIEVRDLCRAYPLQIRRQKVTTGHKKSSYQKEKIQDIQARAQHDAWLRAYPVPLAQALAVATCAEERRMATAVWQQVMVLWRKGRRKRLRAGAKATGASSGCAELQPNVADAQRLLGADLANLENQDRKMEEKLLDATLLLDGESRQTGKYSPMCLTPADVSSGWLLGQKGTRPSAATVTAALVVPMSDVSDEDEDGDAAVRKKAKTLPRAATTALASSAEEPTVSVGAKPAFKKLRWGALLRPSVVVPGFPGSTGLETRTRARAEQSEWVAVGGEEEDGTVMRLGVGRESRVPPGVDEVEGSYQTSMRTRGEVFDQVSHDAPLCGQRYVEDSARLAITAVALEIESGLHTDRLRQWEGVVYRRDDPRVWRAARVLQSLVYYALRAMPSDHQRASKALNVQIHHNLQELQAQWSSSPLAEQLPELVAEAASEAAASGSAEAAYATLAATLRRNCEKRLATRMRMRREARVKTSWRRNAVSLALTWATELYKNLSDRYEAHDEARTAAGRWELRFMYYMANQASALYVDRINASKQRKHLFWYYPSMMLTMSSLCVGLGCNPEVIFSAELDPVVTAVAKRGGGGATERIAHDGFDHIMAVWHHRVAWCGEGSSGRTVGGDGGRRGRGGRGGGGSLTGGKSKQQRSAPYPLDHALDPFALTPSVVILE